MPENTYIYIYITGGTFFPNIIRVFKSFSFFLFHFYHMEHADEGEQVRHEVSTNLQPP